MLTCCIISNFRIRFKCEILIYEVIVQEYPFVRVLTADFNSLFVKK